jgi:hypothetical protein
MSLITTGTAAVAATAGVSAIIAPAVVVAGAATLGYALTHAPFWHDIENTVSDKSIANGSFFGVESLYADLLAKVEKYHERLLQLPDANIPATAIETVAGILAVKESPLIAATLHERFKHQFDTVLDKLPRINDLSRSEIQDMNDTATNLIESALADSGRRLTTFIGQQLKAAASDVGFAIREEAISQRGLAFIAVNRDGQTLAAHVDGKGTVTTDMAGFSGRSCESAIDGLYDALEKRGVRLNRKKEQPHYLFKGGALLHDGPNVRQILKNAEKHEQKNRRPGRAVVGGTTNSGRDRAKRAQLLNRLRHSQ